MDQYDMEVKSFHSTLKHDNKWGISGWANEGLDVGAGDKVDEKAKVEKKNKCIEEAAPHGRSEGLLVDFGEICRSRKCHSLRL